MAKNSSKDIWDLLSKYSFKLDDEKIDDVFCTICDKIMIEPFGAECGCLFCSSCIKKYLTGSATNCPRSKCENTIANVVPSYCTSKKILSLVVKCPNKLCTVSQNIGDIEEHIRVCGFTPTNCPFQIIGCSDEDLITSEVGGHLDVEMCKHSELLVDFINNLRNDVNTLTKFVKNKESERETMCEDLAKKNRIMEEMKQEIDLLRREKVQTDAEINQLKGRFENEVANLVQNIERIDATESMNNDSTNEMMELKTESLLANIKELCFYTEEEFLWRVNDFVYDEGFKRRSAPFYRHSFKMFIRVGMDDVSVAIGCFVMPGEFDEHNEWPLKASVTLAIIDQDKMEPWKSEQYSYDTYEKKRAFDKPCNTINDAGIGNDDFAFLAEMKAVDGITRNNCLLISCSVKIDEEIID